MSRKTYMWFKFAVKIFKATDPYILKADDDIFMMVPLYLKYLKVLPREKLNMGRAVGYYKDFSDEITWHTIGYASTLSRDIVKEIVDYKPLKQLVKSPIKFRNFEQYMDFRALNEDIMIGAFIRNKLEFKDLLTVHMKDCRYVMHAKKDTTNKTNLTSEQTIVLHCIREEDHKHLKSRYKYDSMVKRPTEKPTKIDEKWAEFRC